MAPYLPGSDEFEKRPHYKPYTVAICLFMGFASMSYGTSGAVIGTTFTQPTFVEHMKLATRSNASALEGAMLSLFYAGGVFGSVAHGLLSDRYGRKWSIFIACLINLISEACLTGAVNPAMFIVFRFFAGWGAFQVCCSVPLWISEIVPPKNRGLLNDIHAVALNIGYVFMGYVGLAFYFVKSPSAWRGPIALSMLPPLIVVCGIYFLPESPRFLLMKNRVQEAWTITHKFHSDSDDPNDTFARREFYQMYKQTQHDLSMKSGYMEILRSPSNRKRALISVLTTFFFMSTGILVVNNYSAMIYQNLGYGPVKTLLFQSGATVAQLVFNALAMLIVDRYPRNILISLGLFVMMIFMILEAVLTKYYLGTTHESGLAAAVSTIFLIGAGFSLFLDGPSFFYVAEIWPTHLRAHGLVISTASYCCTNIIWLQAAPTAIKNIGWKYYLIFIIICGIGSLTVYFYFPDTLHRPLEEIAALFGDEDQVAVYQRDLDHGELPLEEVNKIIGGANEKARTIEGGGKHSGIPLGTVAQVENVTPSSGSRHENGRTLRTEDANAIEMHAPDNERDA